MKKQPEYELQKQICRYISLQYNETLFLSDTVASVALTKMQGVRNKAIQKQGFKTPDLIILEPKGKYHGLCIELKIKSPFKKNGELLKSEHLEGQQKSIFNLHKKGYFAKFSWGFEQTRDLIDWYMNQK
jgi:hypothetical protein